MDEQPLIEEVVPQSLEPMDTDAPAIQELHPAVQQEATKGEGAIATAPENEYKGAYNWRIPDFLRQTNVDKLYSEKFEIGTYIWRLLTFPKGRDSNLAVYLDAPEASFVPQWMAPSASFKLIIVNQIDPSKSFSKETSHVFSERESDWGFTTFIHMDELLAPHSPFLARDGSLELRVEIQVQPDPRYAYDSRKETGFVGLKNQGATCYMNSLVQYLFMLPYFRKAVYHMPTVESDDPKKNMPLALQSLFFKLQYSKYAVSTKDLTASFGWTTYDAFLQHDAHELNRVLCEKLEDKMKGTKVERTNQELFEGQILNYLKCLHVNYTSERKESYMDLQLNVRGCKDVYESFAKYIEEEMMDGPNQYNAEGHGLQDAKKGVLFESFPPVLQLHLKRFEYDFQRDVSTKVNDRYEFHDELDLDIDNGHLLAPKADRSVRNLFKLFAVLVHQGGSSGGHYYAYMRPDGKNWYKFDDERVTKEDAKAAIEGQFGGEDEVPGYHLRRASPSNAYMLVYVRISDWDRVFCPVSKEDLNVHLRRRLEQELAEKERKHKEKMEAHQYVTIKVATDADIAHQLESGMKAFDLVDHDLLPPETNHLRLRKHTRFTEVKQLMAKLYGVAPEKQRYWTWSLRPNTTMRAARPMTREEETAMLMDLRELREQNLHECNSKHAMMEIRLYLELPGPFGKVDPNGQLYQRTDSDVLVFLKSYNPDTEKIKYLGKKFFPLEMNVEDIMKQVQLRTKDLNAGLPEQGPLEVWEEVKWDPTLIADRLNPSETVGKRSNDRPMDGDIFILQRAVSEQEAMRLKHPNVAVFLNYLRHRRLVKFKKISEPYEEGFTLELTQETTYDQVAMAVAQHLRLGPIEESASKLRFTMYNQFVNGPQRLPLRFRAHTKLQQMLIPPKLESIKKPQLGGAAAFDILYYEVLDMPLEQLEQLKTFKIYFHKETTEQGSEHIVRVRKDGTVADVLAQLAQQLGPTAKQRTLRLMEVHSSKLYKIMELTERIEHLEDSYWRLRAEFVPEEELSLQEGERLMHCYHVNRKVRGPDGVVQEPQQQDGAVEQGQQVTVTLFGDPFVLKVGQNEPLASVKNRIKAKLHLSDEEFGQWRFWFWTPRVGFEPLIDDNDDVAAKLPREEPTSYADTPYLAMEHRDGKPHKRQSQYPGYQRPIKINS